MKHYGDIKQINGSDVPPVNVIIGGSPCQDLSVAGKRTGLSGERSGLFMEQIRIIKEMRKSDEQNGRSSIDARPRYMVWENVHGAFSSNKRHDFKAVLEETVGIVAKNKPDIPIPKGGWHYSGIIMGDGFSVAWRVFDAQFWGVPQRRRRIALVADFGGDTAPEILFERKGVSRHTPPSGTPWETFAAALAERFGGTNTARENGTAAGFNGWKSVTGSIQYQEERAPTIEANMPPNVVEKTYCIQGNCIDRSDTAGCNGKGWTENVSYTLNTVDRPAVYDARGNGDGQTVPTMTGDHNGHISDYTSLVCGFPLGFRAENTNLYEETATTICCGTRAGHCNGVIAIDRAAFNQDIDCENSEALGVNYQKTIGALCADDYKGINNQYVSQDKVIIDTSVSISGFNVAAFSFDSLSSNSMKSNNPNSGCRQVDVAKTIDTTTPDPSKNQGDNAIVNNSTVRRLTPLECERLQGFPDGWTDIGDYIDTNGKKRKTSDSARYKALGNSIALPSWVWVLERLSYCCGADRTMASLFDGIGGFPLIWETLNGAGTCLWASEIEEFPIAVTKYHFT